MPSDAGKRLLLVDDEPSIRSAFATLLAREGYLIETAGTAEAGERALARGWVDCLILDYRIPDVRGDLFYEYAHSVQPLHITVLISRKADSIDGPVAVSTSVLKLPPCRTMVPLAPLLKGITLT